MRNKLTTTSLREAPATRQSSYCGLRSPGLPRSARNDVKGFTLVELSIVLVVIGLLIGGILVAQSMVGTAKVNAVAMQIGQFDAGVMNFKTKYDALPGDAKAFGGDGDGIVGRGTEAFYDPYTVNIFSCEMANFWNNIDSVQFPGKTPCTLPGAQAITNGAGKNVPLAKLGINNSFFIASGLANGVDLQHADPNNIKNYYTILNGSMAQTVIAGCCYFFYPPTSNINSAVKPTDLLALDKKIDDGIADSGSVISGAIGGAFGNFPGISAVPNTGICSSGITYLVNSPSYECTPLIRIGAQTGDPQ